MRPTRDLDPASSARPCILVMDDARELLDLLREFLEEEGYRIAISPVLLPVKRVKEVAPDLILLDVVFGGREAGLRFLTPAKRDRELRRVPIILCTTAVERVRRLEAELANQQVLILQKPFDLGRLLAVIESCSKGRAPAGASRLVC